jgi:hypothetical protein
VERCAICNYYDRRNGRSNDGKTAQAGQCRRTAPALSPINAKAYMIEGVWPTVRDDDWCGEWKALVRRAEPSRLNEASSATAMSPRTPSSDVFPRVAAGAVPTPLSSRATSASVSALLPTYAPGDLDLSPSPIAFASGRGD